MNSVKFANIVRLMTTYNLDFVTEILPDNLKCVKCKLVLKDACQGPCGCRFCRVCIDDLMASGNKFCLGVSEDCVESLLSDFPTDYSTNRCVSQLTVKCPQIGCVYECELAELEDHMRVCWRKSVECPFYKLGCQQEKLAAEEMNGHFQQENRKHCEMLIGLIADINREMESHKKEIEMLKRSDRIRKMENEMLKHELVVKDEKIKLIMDQIEHVQNEIKSIKEKKADIVEHVQILSEKIDEEIEERRENDQHVDREITAITAVIESNKDEQDTTIKSVKDDIRSINQDSIKSIMDDYNCIKSQMKSIQALAGLGQIDASYEWTINEDVGKMGWIDRTSQYFTGAVLPFKYQLRSWNYISNDELCIRLFIYRGASDSQLPWPWSGTLTITVTDRSKREAYQSVTQQCEISRPSNQFNCSDAFKFSHSSLIKAGLDLAYGMRVSCVIIPSLAGR